MRKRIIAVFLSICLFLVFFPACTVNTHSKRDNELTITVSIYKEDIYLKPLREKFPDINFKTDSYTGSNLTGYIRDQLSRGDYGDLVFYTTLFNDEKISNKLINLSGYEFMSNFDKGILSSLDVNGGIYQIPGPVLCRYIAVNKTLFEERGWKIPTNFDELVDVCKQIRAEAPEITPMGLGMIGAGYPFTLITSYTQSGFLSDSKGKAVEKKYFSGDASIGEVFGEGLDMVGELIDAGAFNTKDFANQWEVTNDDFINRRVAMGYVMSTNEDRDKLFSGQTDCKDEFCFLPYFGRHNKNGLVIGFSSLWGINKNLEKKGNEKKLENAIKVMEYLSSEEGQLAIRENNSLIPALRGFKTNAVSDYMRNFWLDNRNSVKSLFAFSGYEDILLEATKPVIDAMYRGSSENMKDDFVQIADRIHKKYLRHKERAIVYTNLAEDLTEEQTRKICCEAMRTLVNADIAIASECGMQYGIHNSEGLACRLYKGVVTEDTVHTIVGGLNNVIGSTKMTGAEIKNTVKMGKVLSDGNGHAARFKYWMSGVDNIDSLEDSKTYKVAMMPRDCTPELAKAYKFNETETTIVKAIEQYLEK